MKPLRNGICQGSRVRLSFWKTPEEREAELALFTYGIEAKNHVGSSMKFFQVRGERFRHINTENKVSKFNFDTKSKKIEVVSQLTDTYFEQFFPSHD